MSVNDDESKPEETVTIPIEHVNTLRQAMETLQDDITGFLVCVGELANFVHGQDYKQTACPCPVCDVLKKLQHDDNSRCLQRLENYVTGKEIKTYGCNCKTCNILSIIESDYRPLTTPAS